MPDLDFGHTYDRCLFARRSNGAGRAVANAVSRADEAASSRTWVNNGCSIYASRGTGTGYICV
jgi:hypothetical protein